MCGKQQYITGICSNVSSSFKVLNSIAPSVRGTTQTHTPAHTYVYMWFLHLPKPNYPKPNHRHFFKRLSLWGEEVFLHVYMVIHMCPYKPHIQVHLWENSTNEMWCWKSCCDLRLWQRIFGDIINNLSKWLEIMILEPYAMLLCLYLVSISICWQMVWKVGVY